MEYKRLTYFDFENYFLNLCIKIHGDRYDSRQIIEMPFRIIGLVNTNYKSIRIKFFDDKIYYNESNKLSPYCAEIKFNNGLLKSQEIKTLDGTILESLEIEYTENKPYLFLFKLPQQDVLSIKKEIKCEFVPHDEFGNYLGIIKFSDDGSSYFYNRNGEKVSYRNKKGDLSSNYASIRGLNASIEKSTELVEKGEDDWDEIETYYLNYKNDGIVNVFEDNKGKSEKYLSSKLGSCSANENSITFKGPNKYYSDLYYHMFEYSYDIYDEKPPRISHKKSDTYLTVNKNFDILKCEKKTDYLTDSYPYLMDIWEWVFDKDNFPVDIKYSKNDGICLVEENDNLFLSKEDIHYYFEKIRQNWYHEYLTKIIIGESNNNNLPLKKDTEVEFDMFYRIIYIFSLNGSPETDSFSSYNLKTFQYNNQYFDLFENEICHHEYPGKEKFNFKKMSLLHEQIYSLENKYYYEAGKLSSSFRFENYMEGKVDFVNENGLFENIEWDESYVNYVIGHIVNKAKTEISITSIKGELPISFLSFSFLKIKQINNIGDKHHDLNNEENIKYRRFKITDWTGKEFVLTKIRKKINVNVFELITLLDDVVKNISIIELQ